MKTLLILTSILLFLLTGTSYGQTYSDITYDAGTSIDIQTGADVCASNVYINGTFSGGGSICSGALPVELLSFTFYTNKNNVTLNWSTASEINNSGFDVERSLIIKNNIGEWEKIGFVNGNGTSNEPRLYSFEDKKIAAGWYRFRLKQIDYNGNYEYFALENDVVIASPKIFSMSQNYPNPSNPKSKIDYEIPVDGKVTVRLYDILGNEAALMVNETKLAGYYSTEFDGTNLASGVYFYRLTVEGSRQKFSKTIKMVLVK
jgi:hypothetical protein